jgi:hypothetical protein
LLLVIYWDNLKSCTGAINKKFCTHKKNINREHWKNFIFHFEFEEKKNCLRNFHESIAQKKLDSHLNETCETHSKAAIECMFFFVLLSGDFWSPQQQSQLMSRRDSLWPHLLLGLTLFAHKIRAPTTINDTRKRLLVLWFLFLRYQLLTLRIVVVVIVVQTSISQSINFNKFNKSRERIKVRALKSVICI